MTAFTVEVEADLAHSHLVDAGVANVDAVCVVANEIERHGGLTATLTGAAAGAKICCHNSNEAYDSDYFFHGIQKTFL